MKWEDIAKNYLIDTLDFIKSGKDLALTQGQLYIQELVKWEIVSGAMLAVVALSVVGVMIYWNYCLWKKNRDMNEQDAFLFSFLSLFILAFSLVGLVEIRSAARAYVAPRVVIMEKLKDMIK